MEGCEAGGDNLTLKIETREHNINEASQRKQILCCSMMGKEKRVYILFERIHFTLQT